MCLGLIENLCRSQRVKAAHSAAARSKARSPSWWTPSTPRPAGLPSPASRAPAEPKQQQTMRKRTTVWRTSIWSWAGWPAVVRYGLQLRFSLLSWWISKTVSVNLKVERPASPVSQLPPVPPRLDLLQQRSALSQGATAKVRFHAEPRLTGRPMDGSYWQLSQSYVNTAQSKMFGEAGLCAAALWLKLYQEVRNTRRTVVIHEIYPQDLTTHPK